MKGILGVSIAAASGAALCLLAAGIPASAAAGTGSRPVVTHFRASVTSLPASGGSLRLGATVKDGSKCTFSSSPHLHGLPATVSCGRGSVSRTVRLPANAAAGTKAYKFGLTVSGRGGKAAARPVTVVVREGAPGITQVAVQPSDLPSAGGATAMSALVSRSATCTVSATPAVAGLPVTRPCAAGCTPFRVVVPVTLPTPAGPSACAAGTPGHRGWRARPGRDRHRAQRAAQPVGRDGPLRRHGRRRRGVAGSTGRAGRGPDRRERGRQDDAARRDQRFRPLHRIGAAGRPQHRRTARAPPGTPRARTHLAGHRAVRRPDSDGQPGRRRPGCPARCGDARSRSSGPRRYGQPGRRSARARPGWAALRSGCRTSSPSPSRNSSASPGHWPLRPQVLLLDEPAAGLSGCSGRRAGTRAARHRRPRATSASCWSSMTSAWS